MADLTPGMVSYWPLNEANGDRSDLQGSKTLSDVNTVSSGEGVGNAAKFVAADASCLFMSSWTSPHFEFPGSYHVLIWAKNRNALTQRILSRQEGGGASNQYSQLWDSNSLDIFHFQPAGNESADHLQVFAEDQWYFLDWQYNAATGVINIRADLSGSTSQIQQPNSDTAARPTIGARDPGQAPSDLSLQQLFVAAGTTLSDAEVTQIYNAGSGRRWADIDSDIQNKISEVVLLSQPKGNRVGLNRGTSTFEESSGTIVGEQGLVTLSDAADFVAANSERLTSDDAAFQVGDDNFMIPIWVLLDDKSVDRTFISKWGAEKEYRVFYDQSEDRFSFEVSSDGAATTAVLADTIGAPVTGCWYLLIPWHSASLNTINLQVSNTTADSTAHAGGIHEGDNDLVVGGQADGNNYHDGRIGPIGFWKNTILDSSGRTTLWNNGEGVFFSEIAVITLGEMSIASKHTMKAKTRGKHVITSEVAGTPVITMKPAGKHIAL